MAALCMVTYSSEKLRLWTEWAIHDVELVVSKEKTSMAAAREEDAIPTELQDRLGEFDEALSTIENIFEPLHDRPLNELHTKVFHHIQNQQFQWFVSDNEV